MASLTTAQRGFVTALSNRLVANQIRDDAGRRMREAGSVLRAEGQADDVGLMLDMVEAAVIESGLPEGNPHVKHMRESALTVVKVKEAIASGADPAEAKAIALLGGDPRRV